MPSMIWEFIIIILEAFLFFLLINKKLTQKNINHIYKLQGFTLVLSSLLLLLLNQLNTSTLITVSLGLFVHFVIVSLFFSANTFSRLFWVILYTVFAIISDSLAVVIPVYIFHIDINHLLSSGLLRIIFTLVYILLLTIFILITLTLDNKTFCLNTPERLVFIGIAIAFFVIEQIILIALIDSSQIESIDHFSMLTLIFFLVFFLFFSMIFYVYNLGTAKEKNERLIKENLMSNLENKQYQQIVASVKELRIMKHDINNHLITLTSLIEGNHLQKAVSYIQEINESLNKTHYTLSSGNTPIDCIISNKLHLAARENIRTEHTIHLPESIPLSDIESCSLIGNLYDNAIESCSHLMDIRKRFIFLHIKPFNTMLSIKMINSSDGLYYTDSKGKLKSRKATKNEAGNHGIGLKRISDITEKHNGFMEISPQKNTFTITILIPLNAYKTI